MKHSSPSIRRQEAVAALAASPKITTLGSVAQKFVQSLRLIALNQRLGRDPGPDLAVRLGSVELAAKSIYLSNMLALVWPERIHASRFGCGVLSHDELTIGACVDAAAQGQQERFERSLAGLVRPDRTRRLWAAARLLLDAETRAA